MPSRLWGRSCHQSAYTRPSTHSACVDSCSQLNLRNGCNSITTRKARFRQTRRQPPLTQYVSLNSIHAAQLMTWGRTRHDSCERRLEHTPTTTAAVGVEWPARLGIDTLRPIRSHHLQRSWSACCEHRQSIGLSRHSFEAQLRRKIQCPSWQWWPLN